MTGWMTRRVGRRYRCGGVGDAPRFAEGGVTPPHTHTHAMIEEIMMTTSNEYKQNAKIIEGTVLVIDTHELPAVKPARGRKARPARTMGIIGIVDAAGEYVEVTDFSKQWQSVVVDSKMRFVVDRQERVKDGRTTVYHNLVRAVPTAAKVPVNAEA